MVVRWALSAALAVTTMIAAGSVSASGPGDPAPWYLDQYGGDPTDVRALYDGRLGILKPTAPRPMLYIAWRLLHGQAVGPTAGEALSDPCCGTPWWISSTNAVGVNAWTAARKLVPGASEIFYIDVDRDGANYASYQVCFDDAFDTAAATLKDRAAAHGAASPEVKAWLGAQDAVFANCHQSTPLPAPPSDAPPWLRADFAYQTAAAALYDERYDEAAQGFAAIGKDAASPWRDKAAYLVVRTEVRRALREKTPAAFAAAEAALKRFKAAPVDAYGRSERLGLEHALAFREDPKGFAAMLSTGLGGREPPPSVAPDFRDLSDLFDEKQTDFEPLDWIATLRAAPPASGTDGEDEPAVYETARKAALAHALGRWRVARDPAWLLAALTLIEPDDAEAPTMIAAAETLPESSPGWLSAQHQSLRIGPLSSASRRTRLDALLARNDLSVSDRNILRAWRAQASSGLDDFARFALRSRLCPPDNGPAPDGAAPRCIRDRWVTDSYQAPGVFDGEAPAGTVGFGEDARAVIDRSPLSERIALSREASIPPALRLDIALTSYGRAVQLQDNAAVDALCTELGALLPLMSRELTEARTARPGPDKRFAEFLVLAKIPGIRVDLGGYTRPEGKSVPQFQGYWVDWVIATRPGQADPPILATYQQDGALPRSDWPDEKTDLVCLGECGRGAAMIRLPDYVDADRAARERAFFVSTERGYDEPEPPLPAGAVSAWDEMLAYIAAHPSDPRAPGTLYWLVHVGRFGGSHDHSGKRAFRLLHARYPASAWAKKTPFYYD